MLKYQLWVWGAYRVLWPTSNLELPTLVQLTSVKIFSVNKLLITLIRVIWLDISLSGFFFHSPLAVCIIFRHLTL